MTVDEVVLLVDNDELMMTLGFDGDKEGALVEDDSAIIGVIKKTIPSFHFS